MPSIVSLLLRCMEKFFKHVMFLKRNKKSFNSMQALILQMSSRCMEEFFKQGDKEQEQGLDFSPLCDRQTTMVPQSQIG